MELFLDSTVAISYSRAASNRSSSKSMILGACNNNFRVSVSISPRKTPLKYVYKTLFAFPVADRNNYRCFKCLIYRNKSGGRLIDKIDTDPVVELGKKDNFDSVKALLKNGVFLTAIVCGVLLFDCRRVMAADEVVNAGYGVIEQSILLLRNAWPKTLQVLTVFKEQGSILAALLSLSAFFSMTETSITTLWPWKMQNKYGCNKKEHRISKSISEATLGRMSSMLGSFSMLPPKDVPKGTLRRQASTTDVIKTGSGDAANYPPKHRRNASASTDLVI